jgi:hypothetical protein
MTRYLLLATLAGSLAAQVPLEVHVYDWARTPAADLNGAKRVLAAILRVGGIELRWAIEPHDSIEALRVVLVDPPRPGQERKAACAARRDIALSILPDSAVKLKRGVLGYAEPLAPAGINATVLLNRVADAADVYGVSIGVVLGHAIAHEIGHVLLREVGHRKGGLMSGGWDAAQFRIVRSSGMFFDHGDARLMRAAIQGEGCAQTDAGNWRKFFQTP